MNDIAEPPVVAQAGVRRGRRIPVIWMIPVLAIAIAGWLAWDTLSKEGPTISVSFQSAEGLQAGQSTLKFKDITLGTVKRVALTADHTRVNVTIATTREADGLLLDDTAFWVAKPRLFAGNLSGLGTLISGSYIEMLPGQAAGKPRRRFVGLEDPPVLLSDVPGQTFLVKADRLGSVSLGSPVFFRDMTVGEVLGWDLGDMAENATIHVFVRQPFDKYVTANTRFWDASGLSVKVGGAGIEVQLESLRALLLGGIAFETPASTRATASAAPRDVFPLYASQTAADAASYGRKIPFLAFFPGSVRGLASGADVILHGLKVGEVTGVDMTYDAQKDAILAPVKFQVEPERIVGIGRQIYKDPAVGIDELVARGMRATLQSASLITGQMLVSLEFVPDAPPAKVTMEGSSFVVPTSDSGSFAGLQSAATSLLSKVDSMPFREIGQSLETTLQGLQDVTNGPQVKQSLDALTATLVIAQDTLRKVNTGMTPALRQLPSLSADLGRTMTETNKLLLSLNAGYGENTRFSRQLEQLMSQLNEAVRSIRGLTDLLTRHPEALVRGRANGGVE
jgi:paraquat-inducible protein B